MWDKIAEFFSRLLPESFLRGLIDRFMQQMEARSPGGWAKDLLKTALVLIVLGLLVDAWLYWSRRERRELLARRAQAVAAFCRRVADSVRRAFRKLVSRLRDRFRKPDPEAEERAREEAESFSRMMVLDAQLEDAEQNLTEMLEVLPEAEPPEELPADADRPAAPHPAVPADYVPAEVSSRRRPMPVLDEEEDEALPEEEGPVPDLPEGPAGQEEAISGDRSGFARRNRHEAPAQNEDAPSSGAERFWNGGGPRP